MSPEFYHAVYVVIVFALGWTCRMGWDMAVRYHDAKKDHEISRLKWENDQLKRRMSEAPAPLTEEAPVPPTTGSNIIPPPPKEVVIRHPRSPVKAENKPVQPIKTDTKKVPPAIPQSDLGRMNAQLKATGAARIIYNGGTRLWN